MVSQIELKKKTLPSILKTPPPIPGHDRTSNKASPELSSRLAERHRPQRKRRARRQPAGQHRSSASTKQ
jgi:hypothetical protein